MAASRRYDYNWFSKVPGVEGAFRLCALEPHERNWISSFQAWSSFSHSVIEFGDVGLGQCIKRFPVKTLAAGLRVLASAQDPIDALLILRTWGNLADLPLRLNLQVEDEAAFIFLTLEGVDAQVMADLEVMLLTLVMAALSWMVGEPIPWMATYSRSQLFHTCHPYHPEFDCEVRASDWTGVCLPAAWLKSESVQKGTGEKITDISGPRYSIIEIKSSEWWRDAPGSPDRDKVCPRELVTSFDAWLSQRLTDARRKGKNLAFFDTDLFRDAKGQWNGWAHILFDPDCPPALGDRWTIYEIFPSA